MTAIKQVESSTDLPVQVVSILSEDVNETVVVGLALGKTVGVCACVQSCVVTLNTLKLQGNQ